MESLRDVARGLSKRITLSQLVSYDQYVRPYLAALLVAAVASMGEELVIPSSLRLRRVSEDEFTEYVSSLSNQAYDKSGVVGRFIDPPRAPPSTPSPSSADKDGLTLADLL